MQFRFWKMIGNETAKLPQISIKNSVHPNIPEIGEKTPFIL